MNVVTLVGRISQDIRTAKTKDGSLIANLNIAVPKPRNFSEADFFRCVAFGKNAELIAEYTHKGSRIGISGHLTTSEYTNKDGANVKTVEIFIETVEFLEAKEK